jgi:SAM-dependent methyltransferase
VSAKASAGSDASVSNWAKNYQTVVEHLGAQRSGDLSRTEQERIRATVRLIPTDTRSVLDVGCGDGRIVHRLPEWTRPVALDFSHASVRHIKGSALCASSEHLPFPDQSFDLVLCCETIEHLPDEVFRRTLEELARVSRRYILISVPYKENLRRHRTRCSACGAMFHVWGHLRRFTSRQLDHVFSHFRVTATEYVGKREPYHVPFVVEMNQRLGNRWADWEDTTMCPQCKGTTFQRTPRNPVTIACGMINMITSRLVPTSHRNWILRLYRRRH